MAENITNVKLMNVPFSNDYKHTMYFINNTEQRNYFEQKFNPKSFSDFSYQQKDSKLRVNLSFDEAMKYNYVMYQNPNYNSKWFYAFITDYEWKSAEVTELTIETDVMQTWLTERTILRSFIDREHTNDDTVGLNTIPENLEIGEYQIKNVNKISELTDYYIIVACTEPPPDYFGENEALAKIYALPGNYDGIYSGLTYYRFGTESVNDVMVINSFINAYNDSSAVKAMFLYPKKLISSELEFVLKSDEPKRLDHSFKKSVALNYDNSGADPINYYKPKNNKLLTYPYVYLLVSNNNGGSAIYPYEHFRGEDVTFKVEGCLTPGGSIRLIPLNYKGVSENNEEGLNLGKFPICNWTSDEYTNWLTQNSVNIGLNMASGLGQIVAGGAIALGSGGLATAVGGSSIVGGVTTITNQLAQIHQMSFTPLQSHGNINCGDVVTSSKENTFTFYSMTIKPEYMQIADNFFSLYGYKSNRVDFPKANHRQYWWYTKLVDANIKGNIPVKDLNKIKECYNNGVTFWSTRGEMLNYSQNNTII